MWTRPWVWIVLPVVILGALELLASQRRPQLPGWSGPNGARGLMDAHPTRLWGMAPGADIMNAEGTTASVNALGFRGPMPEQPKPSGRTRIVTTGDSSFFGFGVNDEEVFSYRLQSQLSAKGMDVDVMNMGIGGYTIVQHKIFLEEEGWNLQPDLLVLANVWSDNTWDTFHDEDLIRSNRFAAANPLTRSALVKLVAGWWYGRFGSEATKVVVWNAADGWPTDKVRRVPLKRWFAIHEEILLESARRGVGVVLVKPTNSFLLSEDHVGPAPAWTPYFESIDHLGEHFQVPVLDVTAVYKAAMDGGVAATDLLWDKMHPTALGHQVLADAMERLLADAGWSGRGLNPKNIPYDGPTVTDIPNPEWTDDAGAGSPQQKLFDMTAEERAALEAQARIRTAMGNPKRLGGPASSPGEPPGELPGELPGEPSGEPVGAAPGHTATAPVPGWTLAMEISGGNPPFFIKAVDVAGRTVGSARVGAAGRVSLNMPGHAQQVQVSIRDGSGATQQAAASSDAAEVSWDLSR